MDKTLSAAIAVPGTAADGAATAAIGFRSVSKRYRGRAVLREVSFDVAPGSCVAIAGINGAGKSTLLRCLLDFSQPDSGQIVIGGRDGAECKARAALAWLPERFVPPSHLSAIECLQWLAGLRGIPLDAQRLSTMAAQLGLGEPALAAGARALSKGMTQKIGLLSIALSDRPIWVLDEPMSGLDPLARRTVTGLIDTARRSGRTVLFSTHGLRDLPALCDRIVVLHEGRVRFSGSPAAFCERFGASDPEAAFLACLDESAAAAHAGAPAPEACTA